MRISVWPADFLHNPRRMRRSFQLFHKIIQHFIPSNCIITLGLKDAPVSEPYYYQSDFSTVRDDMQISSLIEFPIPKLDIMEPVYSTLFTIYTIPLLSLDYWKSTKMNKDLYLPCFHQFIPDEKKYIQKSYLCDSFPNQLSHWNSSVQMWMVRRDVSRSPMVQVRCEFRSGRADGSLQWSGKA